MDKLSDLVIGGRYIDISNNNDELIYIGIIKSGWFEGEYDFDGEDSCGCICTEEEVINCIVIDKLTSQFIENANKSNQKPIEYLDAFKPSKELDVSVDYVCKFVSVIGFILFVWWIL